jgi:hypothetical protein
VNGQTKTTITTAPNRQFGGLHLDSMERVIDENFDELCRRMTSPGSMLGPDHPDPLFTFTCSFFGGLSAEDVGFREDLFDFMEGMHEAGVGPPPPWRM